MLMAIGQRTNTQHRAGQDGRLVHLNDGWEASAPRCPACNRPSALSPDIIITACSCGYRRDAGEPTLAPGTP